MNFPPLKIKEAKNRHIVEIEKETASLYAYEKNEADRFLEENERSYLNKFTLPDLNTSNYGAKLNYRTNFANYKR